MDNQKSQSLREAIFNVVNPQSEQPLEQLDEKAFKVTLEDGVYGLTSIKVNGVVVANVNTNGVFDKDGKKVINLK